LGFALITKKSKPAEVEKAIAKTFSWQGSRTFNRTVSLLILLGLGLLLSTVSSWLARDGFYTIDYYVTTVFLFALCVSLIFRNFHPHTWSPMVFTKDLWATGQDHFVGVKSGSVLSIDLYQWFHLPAWTRAKYLLHYARFVDMQSMPFYLVDNETDDDDGGQEHGKPELGPGGKSNAVAVDNKEKGKIKEPDKVKCVKRYFGFANVNEHGKWTTRRICIDKDTTGNVLGKTHHGTVMVEWLADEECFSYGNKVDINPTAIIEVSGSDEDRSISESWEGLYDRLHFMKEQSKRHPPVEISWERSKQWYLAREEVLKEAN